MDPPSSPGHNGPSDPARFPPVHGQPDQPVSPECDALTKQVQSPPAQAQQHQLESLGHNAPADQSQPPSSPEHNAPIDAAQSPQAPPNLPSLDRSYCVRDSLSPEIHPMVNIRVNRPRNFAAETRFYNIQEHNEFPSLAAPPLPPLITLPFPPLPDPLPSYKHLRDEYDSDPETFTYRTQDKEDNREPNRRRLSVPAAAPSSPGTAPPPKPRYAIARRRWNHNPASLPWSPLALGFASKSEMSPFSCFRRLRYLRRTIRTRVLSPSPLIPPNPSHSSLEHPSSPLTMTTTTTPLQPVMSPVGSAVESVVRPPGITVTHHEHSPERHLISLPQSVLQLPVHLQRPLPLPVSVPGLMGPPPLPAQNRHEVQEQAWVLAKAQAESLTQARAQAQELAQAQEPPLPIPSPPSLRLIRFLKSHGGSYEAKTLRVFIHVHESSVAKNLYSIFSDFCNERGLEGVKRLDITLDWAWTKGDLERLAAAVRGCRFNTLTINGGNSRPQLHHRAARKGAATSAATLFDPLIQLFGFKPLTCIHFENMPDCLQEFSVEFPADLSHLRTLQVHLDIFNWNYPPGQKFFKLARRLSHIKLLIVECPLEGYRAYLMNIWLGLMTPSAAPINTFSTEPPSLDIEVQLLSRGMVHATAFFKRQGAVPESLIVDLGFIDNYEVTWEYLLNNTIAKNIHTFCLNEAPTEKWLPHILKWLTSRQQRPSSLSSTLSTSTESTPITTTTTTSTSTSTDIYNNPVTEYVRLREISLCCSRIRADSEHDFIELIKLATSPTLGLQRLRLIQLRLPLDSPKVHLLGNQNGGRTTWSGLFINYNLWNLEGLEIEDSNFGDIHIEGFLFFMANMKKLEDDEKTKRRKREERRRQLELGLIALEDGEVEDGEVEEEEDDSDIARMRLKAIRFKKHRLTHEVESCMKGRLKDIDSSIQVFRMNK